MSTEPTTTEATDAELSVDVTTTDTLVHPETLEGRSRIVLPPRSPEPAEALAELEAARTEPELPAPPTYAEMAHLLPR